LPYDTGLGRLRLGASTFDGQWGEQSKRWFTSWGLDAAYQNGPLALCARLPDRSLLFVRMAHSYKVSISTRTSLLRANLVFAPPSSPKGDHKDRPYSKDTGNCKPL